MQSKSFNKPVNDTHREKLCFTQFSIRMAVWLILTVLICFHNQFKNVIHQIDSKNEQLLLSAIFTVRFGLVFVLTFENAFLRGFILKSTERAQVLLKIGSRDFQNNPPFERLTCFYEKFSGNSERFQHLKFETDFPEKENLFQETGVQFFS